MNNEIFTNSKIYSHMDEVNEWLKTKITRPVCMELDLTNRCNSKCPYCTGNKDEKIDLDNKLLMSIIKQCKEFGVKAITLTGGGEPLMYSQKIKAIKSIHDAGLECGIITNGTLIGPPVAHNLIKYCAWVRISLDAANKKDYLKTHGVDLFVEAKQGIKRLIEHRKLQNTTCVIGTAFLINKDSKKDMKKIVKLGVMLGVDYVQFRPYHYDYTMITEEEINDLKRYETDTFKILYSKHKYDNFETPPGYKSCFGHNFVGTIGANGKMYVCCHHKNIEKYCIGDLNQNTLFDIWFSNKRNDVCETINFKDCPPMCKLDAINKILWSIKASQNQKHKNFI